MRVLITGATGFIGSHLVDTLLRRGDQVTALVRTPAKARGLEQRGVRLVAGTLSDVLAVGDACRDQDVVYHLAGLVAARSEAEFLKVNRDGTALLADAAARRGAGRFVLVSSLAAAGPARPGVPLSGEPVPRPVTAYGRSKLAGEQAVRSSGLDWTILRPPAVYGPRDREVLKVFQVARTGFAPVFGQGDQELSAVFGPDLAEAIVAAGTSSAAVGKTYYPAHPEIFTSGDMVRTIGRAMGRSVRIIPLPQALARGVLTVTETWARLFNRATILNTDKASEFFQPAWTCDPASLAADTGWKASHDFQTGAEATLLPS